MSNEQKTDTEQYQFWQMAMETFKTSGLSVETYHAPTYFTFQKNKKGFFMKKVNVFMICFCFLTASLMSSVLFAIESNSKEFVSPAGPLPAPRWTPEEEDVLNVRKFGAMGDGVTDDTAALQAVFKKVNNGQVIFFPSGKYLIKDTLRLNDRFGVQIRMNGGFRSDGSRTADCRGIFWDANGLQDRPMMLISNCGQIFFDGLKLDGGGRAQDGLILDGNASSGFTGDRVHIRSMARYGLRIATWRDNHPVGGGQVDMVSFRDSRFTGCGSKAGKKDANVTVESAQALLVLFDTCHFTCSSSDLLEYNVYMRGGGATFVNCSFGSGVNGFADIYIGENYTASVSAYMCHSEGVLGKHYFLYVDRPQSGALGPCTLERIGTSGRIFFNAYANITISNSGMRDLEIPCPDAKVVLSNVYVYGKLDIGTTSVSKTNVEVIPQTK